MDKQTLAEKLRERRELLGLGQEYMSEKLNMTQPGYSGIENDKVRFTPKLIRDIRSIKDFEDFDRPGAARPANSEGKQTLASKWPLGKPLLYVVVILGGAVCLDLVFQIGEDLYLGFTGETKENLDITGLIAVVYFVLGILLIRWLVFRKGW